MTKSEMSSKILIVALFLLVSNANAIVNLHRQKQLLHSSTSFQKAGTQFQSAVNPHPSEIFEVKKPLDLPKEKPCSIINVLEHDFAFTFGQPPVLAGYTPQCRGPWKRVVLEWKAACKGVQFDRIAGVWLGGAEILRTCTAEPTQEGVQWTILKDITRYSSLLEKPQTLEAHMDNLVNKIYTGVYHVNISLHFYKLGSGLLEAKGSNKRGFNLGAKSHKKLGSGEDAIAVPADVILPISLPNNQVSWFQISSPSDVKSMMFRVPTNSYRAVLEVYVSFHENDEFWYTNLPNDYLSANNITGNPGNGPFREVVVYIDGVVVGAVWPSPVVYSGGINPAFWNPVVGIGSFDLPTYDIELTPFLGKIIDGKEHNISFSVTNALNVWYIDANLHLWVDDGNNTGTVSKGQLTSYYDSGNNVTERPDFKGLDGSVEISGKRTISYSGWTESSHGRFITRSVKEFSFNNEMIFDNNGSVQTIRQKIGVNSQVVVETAEGVLSTTKVNSVYPLYLYTEDVDLGNNTRLQVTNFSNAVNEDISVVTRTGNLFNFLNNTQIAQSRLLFQNNTVVRADANTQQKYNHNSTGGCYSRAVSVRNNELTSDSVKVSCDSS